MKVLKKEKKGNLYFLEIEASVATLNSAMDKAFKKVSKTARIPGFRAGKISRSMFEKHYGQEPIVREAVLDVVNELYAKAVQEAALNIIDYPKNLQIGEYKPLEPLVFSLEVDVMPEVKLGSYKGFKISKETPELTDDEVQKQVEQVRERYAEFQVVDQPAQEKDIVSCSVTATIDGQPYERWTRQNMGIEIGRAMLGSEFDDKLKNHSKADHLSFAITYPESSSNPEVSGKTVEFSVEVTEVRRLVLPELTAEFVTKISKFTTPDEFIADMKSLMTEQKNRESEDKFYNEIMDEIFKNTEVEIQDILVNREIDRYIGELESNLKKSGLNLDQYLTFSQKKIEDVREEYKEAGNRKVKTELVLDAISKAESITVEEQELIDEVKKWGGETAPEDDVIRAQLQQLDTDMLKLMVGRRKAMDFVVGTLQSK